MKSTGVTVLALLSLATLAACTGESSEDAAATSTVRTSIATATTTSASAAATTTPVRGSQSWGGTGVFSVGSAPSHGLKASIPPGRYRVEADDPKLSAVAVTRCSDVPCSVSQNFLGGDSGFGASYVSVIDILETDIAVRFDNAKLTLVTE